MSTTTSESRKKDAGRDRLRWLLPLLLVSVVLYGLLLMAEPVTIGSGSMSPTLETGQRVVLDKLSYHFRLPDRGELVALHAPGSEELTVKRVVAVAGDRVAIKDGVLLVNRSRVCEPYVDHASVDATYFGPVTVGSGSVFVMGDNRAESIDSRAYGAVPASEVVGRVV